MVKPSSSTPSNSFFTAPRQTRSRPSLSAVATAIVIATLLASHAGLADPGFTSVKGQMQVGRIRYAQAVLPNGEVLIAGGQATRNGIATGLASAEIYDPGSGTFRATQGPMNTARDNATATPLPDGTVLIAGGSDNTGFPLQSAELYEPADDVFVPITNQMHDARSFQSATALSDGTVLIAGGVNRQAETLESAEIFNPATQSFAETGTMSAPRSAHVAVRLDDGSVLIAGGNSNGVDASSAEIYDPVSKSFHPTAHEMHLPRTFAAASIMSGNLVLITGGENGTDVLSTAEVYDPRLRFRCCQQCDECA